MKYLHHRDNYLKNINERKRAQQERVFEDLTTKLILEENAPGSGGFGNNVKWGDSLVGRLINFVIRKVGVGIDITRTSIVIKQLKLQFERLVDEGMLRNLSPENKENISKIQMSAILGVLKKAIDDGEKVGKLKDITQNTIDELEELEVSDDFTDKKKVIIQGLKEFLKFLENYKDSDGKGGPLTEDAEKTDDSDDKNKNDEVLKPGEEISMKNSYPTMIKNLKALSLVLFNYKKFKPKGSTVKPEEFTYMTKAGDTIEKIQKDFNINKKKLTSDQIWSANAKILEPYTIKAEKSKMDKNKLQLGKDLKISFVPSTAPSINKVSNEVRENYIFEAGPIAGGASKNVGIGDGGSANRNVGTGKEDHLTQAYTKLKKSCEILEDPKDKGIGVTFDFLKAISDKSVDQESKLVIKSLYKEILRYLIGDKKATLNAPADSLFVESIDTIKDKNKKIIVAEKIARFTMRAIQFDGQNLYAGLGDLGKPLQQFVDSMKELKKIDPEELKEVVKKQESKLLKYDSYLTLIREAEGDEAQVKGDEAQAQGGNKEDKSAQISKEIKEYFDKELDFEDFLLTEEEALKTEQEIEQDQDPKSNKIIVINGMNPIMEIVRLFNRAYKLHTTDVIPGGRTDGAVDRLTYNEYKAFGGGSGDISATEHGPYRHKKTFNKFEDAVFDILADTRFGPVFSKETILDDGSGNIKEGAGVALRQFMLDLLDGDELYKSSDRGDGGGAQKRAIEKYFGEPADSFFEKNTSVKLGFPDKNGKDDTFVNSEVAGRIKISNLQFAKSSSVKDDDVIKRSEFRFTTLQINGKDSEGKPVYWYLFVNEMANDKYYVMMSKTMHFFKKLIESEHPSSQITKGDSNVTPELRDRLGNGPYPIIHTVMTKKVLESITNNRAKTIEVKGIVKAEDKSKTITENIKIIDINWLVLREMEDNKFKSQSILKLKSKDDVANSLKSIKSSFINYRELVDKKYDEGKFTPGVISA